MILADQSLTLQLARELGKPVVDYGGPRQYSRSGAGIYTPDNLGPATTIQLLDAAKPAEAVHFGSIH